jgi:hypothetical protein
MTDSKANMTHLIEHCDYYQAEAWCDGALSNKDRLTDEPEIVDCPECLSRRF